MRSKRSSDLDLARDLPTTAEDVKAQRRASHATCRDLGQYLDYLERQPACERAVLKRRRFKSYEPFEL